MYRPFLYIIVGLVSLNVFAQKDTLHINSLLDKATNLEISNPDEAIKQYRRTYDLSIRNKYFKGAFKSMQNIGFVHSDNGRYDSAIFYYQKAFPFAKKANYTRGIGTTYINTGNSFQFKGDYEKAIQLYLKGTKILESIKDSSAVSTCYQNVAGLYADIKNITLEEYYQNKALQIVKTSDTGQRCLLYCDISLFYMRQNKFEMALHHLKKAKAITMINPDKRLAFFTTRNFGEYYKFTNQYSKAIQNYKTALDLIASMNDSFQKNDLLYVLSGIYILTNDYQMALKYGIESLDLAIKNDSKEIIYRSQKRLAIIYNKLKQPQKAFDFLEKSYTLKDTSLTESHMKQMTLVQTQFETEKKDKAIAEQKIKLNINEVQMLRKEKQMSLYAVVISVLVLLSIGILLFFRQRQRIKNKEIESLKQQQEITQLEALIDGEEKERRRIAQELHDGINGDLSAIKYRISSLEEYGLGAEEKADIQKIIEMIDHSCSQVRSISHNLMPASIIDFGLVETVNEYCSKINNAHPLTLEFQYFGNPAVLPKKAETVIYRIIQELINNIIKHSQATTALVQLNFHESELFITVEDNGIGYDSKTIQNGLGLKNINSRVNYLNAQLEITSNNKGTSFNITIDLNTLKND